MEDHKKHIIIGTFICAATVLLFLVFSNQLPDVVPIQIAADGSIGNTLPKPVVMFGFPVVFVVANLLRGSSLLQKELSPAYSFYIVPGIAVVLSLITIFLF